MSMRGKTAPGFSLKGWKGKAIRWRHCTRRSGRGGVLSRFPAGVPIYVSISATLYQRYGKKTAASTFWAFAGDDAKSDGELRREYGATFPIVLDEKEKGYPASNAYG